MKNEKNDIDTKIICLPGETLSPLVIEKLKEANHKKKKKPFSWYKSEIAKIFGYPSFIYGREKTTNVANINFKSLKYKTFYAGFVVGEGSINVSIKKSRSAFFGILLDPEFSITQHVNGFFFLFAALYLFETGSIHYKSGSRATLVYRIDNRKSLYQKVIPFWETYILPYIDSEAQQRMILFKRILFFLEQKKHKDLHFFVNKMLPIWDKLRKNHQKGQINQTFPDLETAIRFALLSSSFAEKKTAFKKI
jgi:hypothetical protein